MIFIGHYAMLTRCIGTVMHLKCDNEAKALFFFQSVFLSFSCLMMHTSAVLTHLLKHSRFTS